jgi:hypothetical protein
MGYVVGSVLAIAVFLFARWLKFDRDRAFYPTVLMVVGSYYVLFASMAGSRRALIIESAVMIVFIVAAVFGFKSSIWITVAGLVGHGVFDLFHGHLVTNPGVPRFWPAFCMAYDVCAGACLAGLVIRMRGAPQEGGDSGRGGSNHASAISPH